MTKDLVDDIFSGADAFYPGSKRKRRVLTERPKVEKKPWDNRPIKKTLPNGTDVNMYTIGALATALERPIITIRSWIAEGYIPAAPYRLPDKVDKTGNKRKGRRLYTGPMIESAVGIFSKHGLITSKRVEWSTNRHIFNEIDEAWKLIRAQEAKTN